MCASSKGSTAQVSNPAPAPLDANTTGGTNAQRKPALTTQTGVNGNVFTSVLGDTSYGASVQSGGQQAKPLGL